MLLTDFVIKIGRWVLGVAGFLLVSFFIAPMTVESGTVGPLEGRANAIDYYSEDGFGSYGNQNAAPENESNVCCPAFAWSRSITPPSFTDLATSIATVPERSWEVNDNQLPVCTRDVGIFGGLFIGGVVFSRRGEPMDGPRHLSFLASPNPCFTGLRQQSSNAGLVGLRGILLCLPLIADGFLQLLTSYESTNFKRILTGLPFGFGLGVLLSSMFAARADAFRGAGQVLLPGNARFTLKIDATHESGEDWVVPWTTTPSILRRGRQRATVMTAGENAQPLVDVLNRFFEVHRKALPLLHRENVLQGARPRRASGCRPSPRGKMGAQRPHAASVSLANPSRSSRNLKNWASLKGVWFCCLWTQCSESNHLMSRCVALRHHFEPGRGREVEGLHSEPTINESVPRTDQHNGPSVMQARRFPLADSVGQVFFSLHHPLSRRFTSQPSNMDGGAFLGCTGQSSLFSRRGPAPSKFRSTSSRSTLSGRGFLLKKRRSSRRNLVFRSSRPPSFMIGPTTLQH